jgi:hypothetical protein
MYPANSYSIRQATEPDAATLRRLAALRAYSGPRSLHDRLRAAMRPFQARVAGA